MPGASTSLTFDIFAKDRASETFRRLGEQASGASDQVKHLSERLDKIGQRAVNARIGIEGDKEANAGIDKIVARLTVLNRQVANPDVTLEGAAKMRAEISSLELALDRLGNKTARPSVALAKLSFFQPSALGAAIALLPTLIPLAAEASAAVGAIGISFGAAAIGAGAFGLMAANVLTTAQAQLQKLQALNLRLNMATTAAQKKTIQQQITDLKATWAHGFLDLINNYQDFKDKWTHVSQTITVPTLNVWLPVLTKGLQFLKPLVKPVADAFTLWGITLNTYFSDPVHAKRIRELAAAFGNFAAQQLFRIGQFIADIAKGVFNLGKALAASGANFSAFGPWLSGIGDGFLTWSKSAKARADVHGFMKFIHDEGPVVKGILKDLGKLLPGIFAGATTVGTLELQALGNFLNLVASLPPGWQQPVTEFAGAMLLLSKIGVVKVGLKLTGLEGALAIPGLAGAGSAGGPFAVAGAAMAAGVVLKFREDFKIGMKNSAGALGHDIAAVFSGLGGFAATGAQGLADTLVAHFSKQAKQGFHDAWHAIAASFDVFRHTMSASFAAFRHDIVSSFKADWHDIAASFAAFRHTMASSFDAFRHTMSASFAALRHDIATAWDTIWRNTVTRVRNGISDVVTWFRNMPGRVLNALTGLGTSLYDFGHMALTKLWNGMKNVFGSVWNWFKGLPGKLLHAIGINSPPDWAIQAGKHIMGGILHGITSRKNELLASVGSIKYQIGGGVAQWGPLVRRALIMEHLNPLLAAQVMYQMQTESGGNPNAINLTDINAQRGDPSKGLMQVIGSTFAAYHWPGTSWNIYNPLANIAAALNYARHVYGPTLMSGGMGIGSGHGYAAGTLGARAGWAWVGERGPELVRFRGGEQVYPAQAGAGRGSGQRMVLEIRPTGTSAFDRFMADWLSDAARVRGGGSLELAFGDHH